MRRLDHEQAVAALMNGEVVVVPTDTVYGVAARVADAAAVERLFAVKSRPHHVALPVMVSSMEQVAHLGVRWTEDAQRLADRFWPGALTIVVDAPAQLAQRVGAHSSVGLRSPGHDELASIIAQCGPLAVTSANEHGRPPCVSAQAALDTPWASPVAGVLDAGVCDGVVSSVVQLRPEGWILRRQGAVSRGDLEAVLGPESVVDDQ